MTNRSSRRLLEDLITDLALGVIGPSESGTGMMRQGGVRAVSIEFDLPVEAYVAAADGNLVVLADVPRSRTRTMFDLPLGRLSLKLVAETAP